jgi:hypothetical protein
MNKIILNKLINLLIGVRGHHALKAALHALTHAVAAAHNAVHQGKLF